MKDNKVSDKELLVVRDDKRYKKICKWMWHMSENGELNKDTSRKFNSK